MTMPATTLSPKNISQFPHQHRRTGSPTRHLTTTTATTTPFPSPYAVVDHASAYTDEMAGRHGRQLALAYDKVHEKDVRRYPYVPDDDWDNIDDYFDEEGDDDDAALLPAGDDDDDNDNEEDSRRGENESAFHTTTTPQFVTSSRVADASSETTSYTNDGFPVLPPSLLAAYRAGAPSQTRFAVILLSGTQYKITVDDLVISDKLLPVERWAVGQTLTLRNEEVLLVGDTRRTVVGLPFCPAGAEVDVMVEEITRDKKVVVFKKRRRKNSKRKMGFRREVTFLRVLDIRMPGEE
eukprot:CAMPEP_0172498980 /NCGR_PEP_ID=MMETSP1066-20121228/120572_1 /TAXON_ID=671091 /ORGANISM="Coscinodiscus wailesii, Strain CCMP2513" /LENGTH=293 /DNA_ID=CAMNT_0013272497 /DNA_START=289 /DNA_END=1167 /DNA_ORIENTATION=-